MNPLTQIRDTQKASRREIDLGIGDKSSWHSRYKHSAYIFAGGLPFELTEGDLLAIFSQYGEVMDVHIVKDQKTGKSKGFAFLAYEDQRSTVLAVDNLSGARIAGRTIRVEHVDNYRRKKAELEGDTPPADDEDEDLLTGIGTIPHEGQHTVDEPWAAPGSVFSMLQEARKNDLCETIKPADKKAKRKKRKKEEVTTK